MNKKTTRLKEGDIIIALDNILQPGTGVTFLIIKGKKYIVKEYLPAWKENAWHIELKGGRNFESQGWFTEDTILKNFDCYKYLRKEKLNNLIMSD